MSQDMLDTPMGAGSRWIYFSRLLRSAPNYSSFFVPQPSQISYRTLTDIPVLPHPVSTFLMFAPYVCILRHTKRDRIGIRPSGETWSRSTYGEKPRKLSVWKPQTKEKLRRWYIKLKTQNRNIFSRWHCQQNLFKTRVFSTENVTFPSNSKTTV